LERGQKGAKETSLFLVCVVKKYKGVLLIVMVSFVWRNHAISSLASLPPFAPAAFSSAPT
jgi:hypothetical protein